MIILFYFIGLLLGACLGYSLDQYVKESRHINDIAQKHKNYAEYPYIIEENIEGESPVSEKFLRDCKKVAEKYKRDNGGWIPVEKELPPNAKQKGAFCPKYQVMTKYGVAEGWYNPDCESWFCLFWFVGSEFTEAHIDFEHGDVPERVRIEKGVEIVIAWRPLPEQYKPERGEGE